MKIIIKLVAYSIVFHWLIKQKLIDLKWWYISRKSINYSLSDFGEEFIDEYAKNAPYLVYNPDHNSPSCLEPRNQLLLAAASAQANDHNLARMHFSMASVQCYYNYISHKPLLRNGYYYEHIPLSGLFGVNK